MNATHEQTLQAIKKEFSIAAEAERVGNSGMVRVCARRAAGVAVAFWLQANPRNDWGTDAMNHLRNLQHDVGVPQPVREAAARLTARVTQEFIAPFSNNPISDSRIIITHLLQVVDL